MGVKPPKRAPAKRPAREEEPNALSGTLEDYFAAHAGVGEVSAHLLVGTPSNDALGPEDRKSSADDHKQYDSSSSNGKADVEDSSVAGLTLGDYLCVDEKDEATSAAPQAKDEVAGLSLDLYLGVQGDAADVRDQAMVKTKPVKKVGHVTSKPVADGATHHHHQSKKARPKPKRQPQQATQGLQGLQGPVSKSILLTDTLPSQPLSHSSSTHLEKVARERRRSSHSPLPRLGAAASADDADARDHDDSDEDDRLPPL